MSFQRCLAVCRECSDLIGRPAIQAFGDFDTMTAWLQNHQANSAVPHAVHRQTGWRPADKAWDEAVEFWSPTTRQENR